jgi:hypothetical protein
MCVKSLLTVMSNVVLLSAVQLNVALLSVVLLNVILLGFDSVECFY